MSSENSVTEASSTEVIFAAELEKSSEDPPMEEWSSLEIVVLEENKKRALHEEGLYSPGSGEICTKYIAMSDSAVFRHPYYNYPAVLDPGIKEAILDPEEKIVYSEDGQELYLALCKQMNLCPVRLFYQGLLDEVIDLKYYCVNQQAIRAMSMALHHNRIVKVLDLTDNFLNDDACFHLSEMLTLNTTLHELVLDGCRIGPSGAKRLAEALPLNRGLRVVNLSRNKLGDDGVKFFAEATFRGMDIQKLNLSHNKIGPEGLNAFVEAFEARNPFTTLDLSWNDLYPPEALFGFLSSLGESTVIEEVNLSWNSLSGGRVGLGIKNIMNAPKLRHLDISNNMLKGEAVTYLLRTLAKPQEMDTLDLSYNPLFVEDAIKVINRVMLPGVKAKKVLMDNVNVNEEFLKLLEELKAMESKTDVLVTYGYVSKVFKPFAKDMREIMFNRAEFLAKHSKKHSTDIALFFLNLQKVKGSVINAAGFMKAIKLSGISLEGELMNQFIDTFPGPKAEKAKLINLDLIVDYIRRKWPDRKLPRTPPPEPKPVKPKKKGKKKKKV